MTVLAKAKVGAKAVNMATMMILAKAKEVAKVDMARKVKVDMVMMTTVPAKAKEVAKVAKAAKAREVSTNTRITPESR
jgi:hypothetical protein